MRISLTWDEDRTALLKHLWAQGLSCSECADRIGGITRNAVIGKVHRLGLPGRATAQRKPIERKAPLRKKVVKARKSPWHQFLEKIEDAPQPPPGVVEQPIPLHQRRTVETLEAHDCRWPIGDPQDADFHFCGAKKLEGLPYCECRARRAFQPVTGRSHSASLRYSTMAGGFVGVPVRKLEDA